MSSRRWLLVAVVAAAPLVACQLLVGFGELASPSDAGAGSDATSEGATDGGPDAARASAYEAAVLADRPVAYYRFREASGAACADLSGKGNTANLAGSFVRGRPGIVAGEDARSVHLDDGATLVLDPKFDFDFTKDYSFELWFRGAVPDGGGVLFGNLQGVAGNLEGTTLYIKNSFPFFGFERWSKTLVRYAHVQAAVTPAPGGAFFVAVVSRAGVPTVFVNGVATSGFFGTTTAVFVPRALSLGTTAGDYADLAIYDRPLDDVRIVAHYALGRGN